MIVLVSLFAMAIDIGDMLRHRGQSQNAADSAALAGAASLYVRPETLETDIFAFPYTDNARAEARRFVRANEIAQYGPPNENCPLRTSLDIAPSNIVIGRWNNPVVTPDEWFPDAIEVTVPVSDAKILFGFVQKFHPVQKSAVARIKYPHLLPFTVYQGAWGPGQIKVFPGTWDGVDLPPGNFGTLHIGTSGGGTTELRDQIADGVNSEDLTLFGGRIEPGTVIPGETGMSVGMEPAFLGGKADGREYEGIIGEARFLPLYDYAEGNGANAQFRIVKFVAVKVVAVNLKGGHKHVTMEPVRSLNELVGLHLVR
jgi:hypothetical protein